MFILFLNSAFSFPLPPWLNNSLEEQPQFVYDDTGKITGYKTRIGGADTVFPFIGDSSCEYLGECTLAMNDGNNGRGYVATLPNVDISKYKKIIWFCGAGNNSGNLIACTNIILYSGNCTLKILTTGYCSACVTENTTSNDRIKFITKAIVSTNYMPVGIIGVK